MNKKILAVDIDGVLATPHELIAAISKALKIHKTTRNFHDHRMDVVFGVSPEEIANAHQEIDSYFSMIDCRPIKGSRKALKELSRYFRIILLTARDDRYKKVTAQWIDKYYGQQEIIYGSGSNLIYSLNKYQSKMEICKQLKVEFIVEDNLYEIEEFLNSKTVPICFAWQANRLLKNNTRVFRGDWKQITKFLIDRVDSRTFVK